MGNLKCKSPPANATNPKEKSRILDGLLESGDYLIYCPEKNPFFNGSACLNCYHPKSFFNITNLSCVPGYPNQTNLNFLSLIVG